jgi:outer membrane protein OmpA-like peptidoglycan-associated protein
VTAAGTATPLASTPDFNLKTNIASFPLPLVSPYVTQLSGLTVESGTLNMNAAAEANNNALDGKIDLRVGDFHLGEPDSETAARFQENYGVPVGLAVGLLKDSEGVIELSLPVSGTVSEPSVDYSAVIAKAIGGALTSIFPSGLLSSDAGFSIEPVLFEPGSAELTEEGQAAADPLLNALKAKSELRLRVCGKGARADFLVMRNLAPEAPLPAEKVSDQEAQDLLKLAQERGAAVRQYLVSNGIAEGRIGECRTSYSVESDAPPRAEVQL